MLLMGVLTFFIPQIAIHTVLERAKQRRLAELTADYNELLAAVRAGDRSMEAVQTEFDILEAQRRNTEQSETWSYDLPTLVPLVGSAVVSVLLWIGELV